MAPRVEAHPGARTTKGRFMATEDFSAHAHTTTDPATRAGDPFAFAGERCALCFGGYVTITVEEDDQEYHEAVPCRRCHDVEAETV
jgi:hypothetical protein